MHTSCWTATNSIPPRTSQGLLGKAHASKSRLLCMCTRPPQEMYVAKVGQRFYVKRMPNTEAGMHQAASPTSRPPSCQAWAT